MNKPHPESPKPEVNEELVAYLDGELSASDRQRIERRLASESEFRNELSALQGSWDLLDSLPRANVDHELTQTTIAMVTKDVVADPKSNRSARGNVSRIFPWLALSAAAIVGFALFRFPMELWRSHRLKDLPIATNLELYRYADDIQFLQQLQEEGIFAGESTDAELGEEEMHAE